MSKPSEQFASRTDDYLCSVCFEVPHPSSAVETTCCGRFLCSNCLTSILKSVQPRCPTCRHVLDKNNRLVCQDSKFVWRQMQALEVYCDNGSKGSGCRWTGPWADLTNHLQICKFGRTPCRWADSGCTETFPKQQVEKHNNACEFRPFTCPHCSVTCLWKAAEKHDGECLEFPISCANNCGVKIKRRLLHEHKDVCPREMLSCPIAGCGVKIMRQTVEKHQIDALVKHNMLFSRKIIELEQQVLGLLRDNKVINEKNHSLSREMEKFKPTSFHANTLRHGPFRVRIEPFKVKPECHFRCCDVEWYAYLRQDDQKLCLALWPKEFLNRATGMIMTWEAKIFGASGVKALSLPSAEYEITPEQIQGYLVNISESELLSNEWLKDGKLCVEFDNISIKHWMW